MPHEAWINWNNCSAITSPTFMQLHLIWRCTIIQKTQFTFTLGLLYFDFYNYTIWQSFPIDVDIFKRFLLTFCFECFRFLLTTRHNVFKCIFKKKRLITSNVSSWPIKYRNQMIFIQKVKIVGRNVRSVCRNKIRNQILNAND